MTSRNMSFVSGRQWRAPDVLSDRRDPSTHGHLIIRVRPVLHAATKRLCQGFHLPPMVEAVDKNRQYLGSSNSGTRAQDHSRTSARLHSIRITSINQHETQLIVRLETSQSEFSIRLKRNLQYARTHRISNSPTTEDFTGQKSTIDRNHPPCLPLDINSGAFRTLHEESDYHS